MLVGIISDSEGWVISRYQKFSYPTRKCSTKCRRPKAFSSQITTTITTTAFRIDLIDPAIGMKVFTSQRRTPTTIRVRITVSKGIISTSITKYLGFAARRDVQDCTVTLPHGTDCKDAH